MTEELTERSLLKEMFQVIPKELFGSTHESMGGQFNFYFFIIYDS
jgi:hypothetical protein